MKEVQFSHNDMVVVSLNIVNYDVCYILMDNRSSIDVLFYDAFSKIDIFLDWLGRLDFPFVGFTGDAILVKGVITLSVTIGREPC